MENDIRNIARRNQMRQLIIKDTSIGILPIEMNCVLSLTNGISAISKAIDRAYHNKGKTGYTEAKIDFIYIDGYQQVFPPLTLSARFEAPLQFRIHLHGDLKHITDSSSFRSMYRRVITDIVKHTKDYKEIVTLSAVEFIGITCNKGMAILNLDTVTDAKYADSVYKIMYNPASLGYALFQYREGLNGFTFCRTITNETDLKLGKEIYI